MTLDRELDALRTKVSGCKALGLVDLPSGFLFAYGGPADVMGMVQSAGSSAARLFEGAPKVKLSFLLGAEEPVDGRPDPAVPTEAVVFSETATFLLLHCGRDAIGVFLCDATGDRNLTRLFIQAREVVDALRSIPWGRAEYEV